AKPKVVENPVTPEAAAEELEGKLDDARLDIEMLALELSAEKAAYRKMHQDVVTYGRNKLPERVGTGISAEDYSQLLKEREVRYRELQESLQVKGKKLNE